MLHAVSLCLHGLLMSDSFGVSVCCLCINMRCKINDFCVSFAFLLVFGECIGIYKLFYRLCI